MTLGKCVTGQKDRLFGKAYKIESFIFKKCGSSVNETYKDTTRSHIWNLCDKKNPELRQNVIEGLISEEEFAKMNAEEMASQEEKIKNKIILQNALQHSIGIEEMQPIEHDDYDPNEPRIVMGDRAGNRVWSGSDLDATF
nr:3049_t:CDS:2 [Entrophospora candida]